MVTEKRPAWRWLPGIATAALLAAVASAAAAPPAAAARHSPAAISASQPPGYQVVSSGFVNAPPGSSSGAFATCPAGTVVWGGGVAFSHANGPSLTANTSSPNGSSGWEGWVNNTGNTTVQFSADAICAA